MATRTLAETAGEVLVLAFRSGRADEISLEVRVVFETWQVYPPEDLFRPTRQSAGPLSADEERALAARWQQQCEDLLEAHPDAEPHLRVLVEALQRITTEALFAPRAEPDGSGGGPSAPQETTELPAAPKPAPAWKAIPHSTPSADGADFPSAAPPAPQPVPPSYESSGVDPVSYAIQSAVRPGLLAFNPPDEMGQGRTERVEVGIARSAELMDALVAGLRGRGEVRIEQVPTSAFMSAGLRGDYFIIRELSPAEQIVAPSARWEFDVIPRHAGVQTLTLCVSMRFAETGQLAVPGSRIAVPVVERQIRIRVNVGYGTRAFVGQNWQWLVGTAVAVAGALAAFLAVIH